LGVSLLPLTSQQSSSAVDALSGPSSNLEQDREVTHPVSLLGNPRYIVGRNTGSALPPVSTNVPPTQSTLSKNGDIGRGTSPVTSVTSGLFRNNPYGFNAQYVTPSGFQGNAGNGTMAIGTGLRKPSWGSKLPMNLPSVKRANDIHDF